MSEVSGESAYKFANKESISSESYIPKVEYDADLLEKNVPYSIKINELRLGELMLRLGMKKDKIRSTKVTISRKPPETREGIEHQGSYGVFDSKNQTFTIFADEAWEDYKSAMDLAQNLIDRKIKPSDEQFDNLLRTKRLSKYLTVAPTERALNFSRKILGDAFERHVRQTLEHESVHTADSQNKLLSISDASIQSGIYLGFVGIPAVLLMANLPVLKEKAIPAYLCGGPILLSIASAIAYKISPTEIRARNMVSNLAKETRWDDLISVKPKD